VKPLLSQTVAEVLAVCTNWPFSLFAVSLVKMLIKSEGRPTKRYALFCSVGMHKVCERFWCQRMKRMIKMEYHHIYVQTPLLQTAA